MSTHTQVTEARLDIYPDGGISRLRLPGVIPAASRGPLAQRWLSLLPPGTAAQGDQRDFFA